MSGPNPPHDPDDDEPQPTPPGPRFISRWARKGNTTGLDAIFAAWPKLTVREVPDGQGGYEPMKVTRNQWRRMIDPDEDVWPHLRDETGRLLKHHVLVTRDRDRNRRIVSLSHVYENGWTTLASLPRLKRDFPVHGYTNHEVREICRTGTAALMDWIGIPGRIATDDDLVQADPTRAAPVWNALAFDPMLDAVITRRPRGAMDAADPQGPKHGPQLQAADLGARPHRKRHRKGFPPKNHRDGSRD